MDSMELSSGFVISLAVLDLIAIAANLVFLYVIKCRAAPYNAIDIVQILKTVLVIGGTLVCVWLDLFICRTKSCTGVKYIFDDIFYHSACLTFLSVAYTRRTVCECRGRASVLVTTKYAIKIFVICLIPVFLFNAVTLSLMSTQDTLPDNSTLSNDVMLLLNTPHIALELCRVIFISIVPIVVSVVLYGRIFQVILQTAKTMGPNAVQRNRDPTKQITQSVIILLCVTCIVWFVYILGKTVSLFVIIDERFFIYWKTVIFISHPFGEGLVHPSARTPVRRVQEWIHERSVRRIGPSISPTQSYGLESDDNGCSLAEQLPTLIEERGSMQTQSQSRDNRSNIVNSGLTSQTKIRRPSIRYIRPSMLVRNAAYIGLECRDTSSVINVYRGRKDSVDKLNRELRGVEELPTETINARRLSTCLRLSSMDGLSEDEVYERYREMYSSQGSVKYSDRSNRKRSNVSVFAPEYKGLLYASSKERKESEGSSGFLSPSHRRWKKLYTTARSARRFSKLKNNHSSRIEEEVGNHSLPSCSDQPGNSQYFKSYTKANDSTSGGAGPDNVCGTSPSRGELYGIFTTQRRSVDGKIQTQSRPKMKNPSTKKRSISCVQNAWRKTKESDSMNSDRRKTSVSFISGAHDVGESRTYTFNNSRSLSYDAEEYYNYQMRRQEKDHLTRRSYGNNSRHSQDNIKVAHWLLEKNTTKDECIEKLVEMKDYF